MTEVKKIDVIKNSFHWHRLIVVTPKTCACLVRSITVIHFQGTFDYFAISLFDRSKCGSKTTGTGRRVVFTNRVSTPKRRRHPKRLEKEQEINKELRLEINFFRDFCLT